eukprot:COSAG03_NODE_7903_length_857_cov_18.171504_2_plen_103_part_00
MFNHHDPKTERDHSHFVRCAQRFAEVVRLPSPAARKLLVLVDKGAVDKEQAVALFEALLGYGAVSFELLVVGAPHWHFLPCHSFSHTTLKGPCKEQGWTRPR